MVREYLLSIMAGVFLVVFFVSFSTQIKYPYTPDSAGYIEEAVNLLDGNGMGRTTTVLHEEELAPTPYHPPGYSLLIAAISAVGFDAMTASLWVVWIAWSLVPVSIVWCLHPVVGWKPALSVGLLSATSPGLFQYGYVALPDVIFLVLSIISLGFLVRSFQSHSSYHCLMASGLLVGLAYCFRNTGLAVFAAVTGFYFSMVMFRWMAWPEAGRRLLVFWAGCSLFVVILIIHNINTFGQVQPYAGNVFDYGMLQSIRLYLWSIFYDISGLYPVAQVAWDIKLFLGIAIPILVVAAYAAMRKIKLGNPRVRMTGLLLLLYLFAGSSMIVIVRARYDLVEQNLIRHAMQYSWLVIGLFVILIAERELKQWQGVGLYLVFAVLLIGHAAFIANEVEREYFIEQAMIDSDNYGAMAQLLPDERWILTNQIKRAVSMDAGLMANINQIPENAFVVSNVPSVLHLATGRRIRRIELEQYITDTGYRKEIKQLAHSLSAKRPFYWVIIPTNSMLKGNVAWQHTMQENFSGDFVVRDGSKNYLLLEYSPI